jgi:hypothetical protein
MSKHQETPSIFYQRTGILSTTTNVDTAKAEKFMKLSALGRNIVITDSNNIPDAEQSRVGDDVLTWKTFVPEFEGFKQAVGDNKYRQVIKNPTAYEIQINDQEIGKSVGKSNYSDSDDYQRKFLDILNQTVRVGILTCLTSEKLGIGHISAYGLYVGYFQRRMLEGSPILQPHDLVGIPLMNIIGNILIPMLMDTGSPQRNWKEAVLPLVPIDRWLSGSGYLFTKGRNLIVPSTS